MIIHGNYGQLLIHYVCKHMQGEFPQTVSYNRFVELMEKEALSMAVMLRMFCLGECTGISYVDSTPLRVCKNKRIHNHKVFKGLAQVGKSTMGWFYGFKLHLLLNEKGEILNFVITPGNTDDRDPLKDEAFLKKIKGKLYGRFYKSYCTPARLRLAKSSKSCKLFASWLLRQQKFTRFTRFLPEGQGGF